MKKKDMPLKPSVIPEFKKDKLIVEDSSPTKSFVSEKYYINPLLKQPFSVTNTKNI
jgi:hypothetical protein